MEGPLGYIMKDEGRKKFKIESGVFQDTLGTGPQQFKVAEYLLPYNNEVKIGKNKKLP
jgi:hypothetical protein